MNKNLIDLSHFHNGPESKYHIYKLNYSAIANSEHYHDYYQVLYVCSGEIIHTHENESIRLYHGDAFIIPPYFTHFLNFPNHETDVYSLAFSMDLFHEGFVQSDIYSFLTGLNKQNSIHLKISLNTEERSSVNSLLESLILEKPGKYCAAPSLISSLICILARSYSKNQNNRNEHSGLSDIIRCTEYIDNHYNEDISIQFLAKNFNMSSSDLCRKFPKATGLTVNRYINLKRINAAEALLRTFQYTNIQTVAEKSGYNDFSTFYRNFVKITGVNPSSYASGQK